MSDGTEARTLHVFVDDYPSFWVAYDLADLKAYIVEECGEDAWYGDDAYRRVDDDAEKKIWLDHAGCMATVEEVAAGGCTLTSKTWAEWAAKEGRGYMGGAE